MADISELLGANNPDSLKKLLEMRDKLTYGSPVDQSSNPSDWNKENIHSQASPEIKEGPSVDDVKQIASFLESQPQSLPQSNGGLTGQALADAIKQNPGPVATTGFNPAANSSDNSSRSPASENEDAEEKPKNSLVAAGKELASRKKAKESPQESTSNSIPVQDLLSKLLGDTNKEMDAAKEQRNNLQLAAILGRAGQQMGAAMVPRAGVKPDDTMYNTMLAAAQQPVSDVQAKRQAAMDTLKQYQLINEVDPNSSQAGMLRDVIKQTADKAGLNLSEEQLKNASPATMEKLEKYISAMAKSKEAAEARADTAKENRAMREALFNRGLDIKEGGQIKGTEKELRQALDPAKVSSRSPMGRHQITYENALNIEGIINQYKDNLDAMPKTKLYEIARAMDSMISRGQPTQGATEHIVPKSLLGDTTAIASYLSNQVKGAQGASFIKDIYETVKREKEISQERVKYFQQQSLNSFKGSPLATKYPDRFKSIANSFGFDEDGNLLNNQKLSSLPGSKQSSGFTRMKAPDGTIRNIPNDLVEQAKASGGQVVE